MKALIVYAHPREEGLNKGILETVVKTLKKQGHEVTVRDLYRMNFDPVLSGEDTIHIEEGHFVREKETYPKDVEIEQQYILENDLLIYIFPIWWNSFPAILKGYIDRVFAYGFAYSFEDATVSKQFSGKKALFFSTTGQPQTPENEPDTVLTQAIKTTTSGWIFNANDTEVIDHIFYGRVPYLTNSDLENILRDVENRIEALDKIL